MNIIDKAWNFADIYNNPSQAIRLVATESFVATRLTPPLPVAFSSATGFQRLSAVYCLPFCRPFLILIIEAIAKIFLVILLV